MFTSTKREDESLNQGLDEALVRMASYTTDLAISVSRYSASNKSFREYLEGKRPAREAHEIPKLNFDE